MRVAEFEKVSFEQFIEGANKHAHVKWNPNELKEIYDNIQLPTRATAGSSGYDFKSPFHITLAPKSTVVIPTGIRVKIDEGWWLAAMPRSGLGFKYHVRLANTIGNIDSDYYFSDNEGHIFLKIVNGGLCNLDIQPSQAFAQGVFLPYGITYSDDASGVRNGGMGSTDKI